MNILLPDGNTLELENGATLLDAANTISRNLGKKAIAGTINDTTVDLATTLRDGDKIKIITDSDSEGLEIIRHSTAHLMAQAVLRLFPETKVTIGPVVENGFYYDFDRDTPFTPEDLEKIEKEMAKISQENIQVYRSEISSKDAIERFTKENEPYKCEIITDLGVETVSLYSQGDFTDLCRGPHVPATNKLKHFKLLSVAGAYWRGDEKNKQLQRIYGTAWATKKELDDYLNMLAEAKKRDHRRLGKQLKLFTVEEEAGAGFPIYLPRGGMLRATLEQFERAEHIKRGYEIVYGPSILKKDLWVCSGHYDNYKENMYFTEVDDIEFGIKPMNCLSHILVYKSELRSYRDLPQRYFELGTVHRHEKSGVLHGLMRVRAFTQDDAHIFCRPDQLLSEIGNILDFVKDVMDMFGFEFIHTVSTKPEEKYIGSDEIWDTATKALIDALNAKGLEYTINEGDGAFYGPKIDIKLKDAIGRLWQCATIQCDFNLPERFDLNYIGDDGEKHRPVMLHRVILGSVDRFLGVLIEHFAGAFPFWIAPVQIKIMNITDDAADYANEIADNLRMAGFRVEKDLRNEKIGFKIREAQLEKIPHMIVLGKNEAETKTISVRLRNGENKNSLDFSHYISVINSITAEKSLDLWRWDIPPTKDSDKERVNEEITASEIRAILDDGTTLGVVTVSEALRVAAEKGLDLVEVAPQAKPPVCRIMDYSKYKFEKNKKEKEARKKQRQHQVDVKEIKFRPRTEEHDYNVKLKHIRRFLEDGDKVKIVIRYRGREMMFQNAGIEILNKVLSDIDDIGIMEKKPEVMGKQQTMVVAPKGKN